MSLLWSYIPKLTYVPLSIISLPFRRGYKRGFVKSPTRQALELSKLYADEPEMLRFNPILSLATNMIMKDGKKQRAIHLLHSAFSHLETLEKTSKKPATDLFLEAVEKISPVLSTKSIKKGTKVVHMPRILRERQRQRSGIQWIIDASDKRTDKEFGTRLAKEIMAVLEGTSLALAKKEALYKLALANRAHANLKIKI
ncbi:hypothetical protein HMI54_001706 [Coelomomyces lativittatus]|nr:hypothetical protein HMI54_001706 [Coelomomyces lativittatus]KAJ1510608.1 hypothetical protein HMI56_006257 [Coelomomyces lativittatus]KAJ1513844.1 hypothetical protein HMI55_005174 [Coelomomyces lativittatus]